MAETRYTESFKVAGQQLLDAVKKLIHEGNVRRVVIKHGDHTIADHSLQGAVTRCGRIEQLLI